MDLTDLLKALRRSWWIVLLGLVAGGAAAAGVTATQTPQYESQTQFFVSTANGSTTSEVLTGSQLSEQRVSSYTTLLVGQELSQRVSQRLGGGVDAGTIAAEVSTAVPSGTVLIDVTVTDPSPTRAQQIASAIGAEFPSYVADLETPESSRASPIKVTVTSLPQLPGYPSSPNLLRNVAIGLFGGLVIGVGIALLRAQLDRSVRDADSATSAAGAPVIGLILRDEALQKNHVVDLSSGSRTSEAYRQLRTNLTFLNVDEPPKVIMVSSAVPSEGKTTLAVNLALTLAESGRSVALVEADLRRPRVTRYLGMVGGAGLTNILAGSADLRDVVQAHGRGQLKVLAAGPTPPNPSELLASSHMYKLVEQLRGEFDFVLIDAPPLLPVADASGLAVIVDGVVLSVRFGATRSDQLAEAKATLDRVGARTLGVVLNIVPARADITSAYGYGYNYAYDADRQVR